MDSVSVKTGLVELIRILDKENSYVAKFMDEFFELPLIIQKNILGWVATELDREDWLAWIEDETLFLKTIRAMLFFYTGRDDLKQPCREDFKKMIGEYIRDGAWERDLDYKDEDKDEFLDALEGL